MFLTWRGSVHRPRTIPGPGPVACEARDTDRYGRIVAVCSQSGIDLNAWMVEEGHALAYRQYSKDYVPSWAQSCFW